MQAPALPPQPHAEALPQRGPEQPAGEPHAHAPGDGQASPVTGARELAQRDSAQANERPDSPDRDPGELDVLDPPVVGTRLPALSAQAIADALAAEEEGEGEDGEAEDEGEADEEDSDPSNASAKGAPNGNAGEEGPPEPPALTDLANDPTVCMECQLKFPSLRSLGAHRRWRHQEEGKFPPRKRPKKRALADEAAGQGGAEGDPNGEDAGQLPKRPKTNRGKGAAPGDEDDDTPSVSSRARSSPQSRARGKPREKKKPRDKPSPVGKSRDRPDDKARAKHKGQDGARKASASPAPAAFEVDLSQFVPVQEHNAIVATLRTELKLLSRTVSVRPSFQARHSRHKRAWREFEPQPQEPSAPPQPQEAQVELANGMNVVLLQSLMASAAQLAARAVRAELEPKIRELSDAKELAEARVQALLQQAQEVAGKPQPQAQAP